MPVLKTLVDEETKAKVVKTTKSLGLSESEFLRVIISEIIESDKESEHKISEKTDEILTTTLARITVRMPTFVIQKAKKRAEKKKMALSRWIAALVQSNLLRQPVHNEREILILQASNRELAAIGRNINQIAKTLNESFYKTEAVRIDMLAELTKAIEKNKTSIDSLIRASQNVWEVE
ncbi:MobC family plasmid mobilization relaxosome protein [Desulfopila sp. IMCC35006]|uniref:plasmid mobilization relaxosome protein MobC n=1 Tax=Desulfopila sp. IMCC35006 TaxID=2569542 RepID=UPI0010AC98C3|nr:plasmid mobilization relaxosome protein MobC [Desulfopila sp. IMCC35006]TKB23511.1 MobC family plasmid mobilization relaxosome protein [Desulfopila sp. IMCC35006]